MAGRLAPPAVVASMLHRPHHRLPVRSRCIAGVALLLVVGCGSGSDPSGGGGASSGGRGGAGGGAGRGGAAGGAAAQTGGTTGAGGTVATGGAQGIDAAGGVAVDGPPSSGLDSGPSDLPPSPDASDAAPAPAGTAPSAGCASGTTVLPDGDGTIMVGGVQRQYRIRLPAGYTAGARPWPVVLALHANGAAGMAYWDNLTGLRGLRGVVQDKAILVLPQSLPGAPINRPGFDWRERVPQELAYFEALLGRVKSNLCVDTTRIFSMGFSGGGSFSGVLGCHRKDIRAIAVAGSVPYFEAGDCVAALAAWVAISAGDLSANSTQFRDVFRTRAMCGNPTTMVAPAGCVAYACPPATPVHYCAYPGEHAWPSFGTQATWDFFARF